MINDLYTETCFKCSKLITQRYSTSFTLGIKTLDKKFHSPVYAIYGFVRFADEIVDTFHNHNKTELLVRFKKDTYDAIKEKVSLNPVLHAFQKVVNDYTIDHALIEAFLHSMEMDLNANSHSLDSYEEYIYGSAEVVGLMCLQVFCQSDRSLYEKLVPAARHLGAAFQKVNFLRDIQSDFEDRGRIYFPGVDLTIFTEVNKKEIEKDIANDFSLALEGIRKLPKGARSGVYLAYIYYIRLFQKIKSLPPSRIMQERIRIADSKKLLLWLQTYFKNSFNYI